MVKAMLSHIKEREIFIVDKNKFLLYNKQKERLVVCVQESKRFSSWHWKGKIERQEEFILTMKTKGVLLWMKKKKC